MASISLPPQHQPGFSPHSPFPSSPSNSDHSRRLTMPAPLPNPPFVFPARDSDQSPPQSKPKQRRAPSALPTFSFNPGASTTTLQPPPVSVPAGRPAGHRRRPSEFVGGDQLVIPGNGETTESREEVATAPPVTTSSGPSPARGPGRRHHAHRRSAAISGVDLLAIHKALNTNPAASAPTLPSDSSLDDNSSSSRPFSQSTTTLGRPTPPASPRFPAVSAVPPVPPIPAAIRLEHAQSIFVEDGGRPVSAVSHQASPSAQSVKFEQQPEPPTPTPQPLNRGSKQRPKTADAFMAFNTSQGKNIPEPPLVKRSKSTGHSRFKKDRSVGNLDATLATQEPGDTHSACTSRPSYSTDGSEMSDTDDEGASPSAKKSSSKSKKKQKRIRSWAGGILARKPKRHTKNDPALKREKKGKPPALTPPTLTRTNSEVGSMLEVDFDNDDVVVLRTPTNTEAPVSSIERAKDESPIPMPSLETAWKPRSFYEQNVEPLDDILTSPVIDLDAALGPFNTPGDSRPSHGTPSKFHLATQRMYSGGRRGDHAPFDRSALGAVRLTGPPAMDTPDVFYEEDEDAFLAANQSPKSETASSAPVPSAISEALDKTSSLQGEDQKSAKGEDTEDTTSRSSETKSLGPTGLGIQASGEPSTDFELDMPGPTEEEVAVSAMHAAPNPFSLQSRTPEVVHKLEACAVKATGPPSPDMSPRFLSIDKRPATSPQEMLQGVPPLSLSAGVSPSECSFPSPDVARFNDRTFSSHSYHHLPSEYPYASVDDVPSLTSSASTMTGTVHRFSDTFFPRVRLSTDRAASFSAAVNRRGSQANSSKRSSLVSISKLVGGSHSERSKLSQEEKPPGDAPEKTKKKHRISRLMHFWKVKEREKQVSPTVSDQPIRE
ncbi:hypothetical protein N7539_002392 [Penicillium diatomitis]|uniref:Cell wall proline rich protein n=1 Tax=Penicillium diatomitis TaxID=2819901 RepID=A0A9X0BYL4_9EURO|nr:uncharacterized protein N7539_002392 [Penicillium diatomitis]KAJ5490825.1 hypothetical protein N7539_002392 [Penicillium diatomitis]